ncbi:MAG: SDR family oxidoreductase [Clostridia bacterium]|nr:SDR family oxidoreductase [Clostridia bacterium]
MKVALISGVSGGIGGRTAELFAEKGYFVLGLYGKNENGIKKLESNLKGKGLSDCFFAYKCYLCSVYQIKTTLKKINESFKHIDALINVAGIDLFKQVNDTTDEEWDNIFSVNVKSVFMLTKFALGLMIPKKYGKIVNISSIWGLSGASMESAYSASKAALIGFTKSVAKEVGDSGITANCICPGVIDTKMNDCFTDAEKAELIARTPLSRMGRPDEIAKLAYFLCSEDADFITGQTITVDGGFLL